MKNAWNPKQFKKSDVRGNSDDWANAAKALKGDAIPNELETLGLTEMPKTLRELQRARNRMMLTAHPDRGGSNKSAQEVQDAYEKLKLKFEGL